MKISIIIPTYHRPSSLWRALSSLQEQIGSNFEIIVVDNAADPKVEQLIKELNLTARITVDYIKEPCLGLHYARHTGVCKAKGDLLVFSDDDATFDPNWLQAYAQAFDQYPEMMAAGGPVRPVWESPPSQWLLELKDKAKEFGSLSLREPYPEFRLAPNETFYGVNMAIRRHVLFAVGGFNPEAFGDVWLGDGEDGLSRKLQERALLIGYIPEAMVYHHIPPQRMTVNYLCQRTANEGASTEYAALYGTNPGLGNLVRRLVRIGGSLVRLGLVTVARLTTKKDSLTLIKARIGLAYHLSRLRYVLRLCDDPSLRELVARKNWLEETDEANTNACRSFLACKPGEGDAP